MKGAMVKSVPKSSFGNGDLIDDHAWSVLLAGMRNENTDGVFFTLAASMYKCEATDHVPALRALDGQGWFGLPGIPAAFKKEIRSEDLAWLRKA